MANIVWNFNANVAYKDNTNKPVEINHQQGLVTGPDISTSPQVTELLTELGYAPPPAIVDPTINSIVYRFSATMTEGNGGIRVLGKTESIKIILSNDPDLEVIKNELQQAVFFTDYFKGAAPKDDASFSYAANQYELVADSYAASDTPVITGVPGGTFSFTVLSGGTLGSFNTSTGTFDTTLTTSSVGVYRVTYTTPSGPHQNSSYHDVELVDNVPLDNPNFSYAEAFYELEDNSVSDTPVAVTPGGTFSYEVVSGGELVINQSTGVIDLEASEVGTYKIFYTTPAPDQASSFVQIGITNDLLDSAEFTYSLATYPLADNTTSDTPVVTGVAGGVFTVTPAGLSINSTTGVINLDPDISTAGAYTVRYTTPAGVDQNFSEVGVTLSAGGGPDNAIFYYPEAELVCNNESGGTETYGNSIAPYNFGFEINCSDTSFSAPATIVGVPGGTFTVSGPGNQLPLNPTTGAFGSDISTGYGIHTIRYTTPAGPNQNFSEIQIEIYDNY